MVEFVECGFMKISKTRKGFHILYRDSVRRVSFFVSRSEVRRLDKGEVSNIKLFMFKPEWNNKSCESHES